MLEHLHNKLIKISVTQQSGICQTQFNFSLFCFFSSGIYSGVLGSVSYFGQVGKIIFYTCVVKHFM